MRAKTHFSCFALGSGFTQPSAKLPPVLVAFFIKKKKKNKINKNGPDISDIVKMKNTLYLSKVGESPKFSVISLGHSSFIALSLQGRGL